MHAPRSAWYRQFPDASVGQRFITFVSFGRGGAPGAIYRLVVGSMPQRVVPGEMSVMPVPVQRSFHVKAGTPAWPFEGGTPLRRLPLLVAALIPLTATVLTVQPAQADDPTELVQDELPVSH